MDIKFTSHALNRCADRKLNPESIKDVVSNKANKISGRTVDRWHGDHKIICGRLKVGKVNLADSNGDYVIASVKPESDGTITIVTVMFMSGDDIMRRSKAVNFIR